MHQGFKTAAILLKFTKYIKIYSKFIVNLGCNAIFPMLLGDLLFKTTPVLWQFKNPFTQFWFKNRSYRIRDFIDDLFSYIPRLVLLAETYENLSVINSYLNLTTADSVCWHLDNYLWLSIAFWKQLIKVRRSYNMGYIFDIL